MLTPWSNSGDTNVCPRSHGVHSLSFHPVFADRAQFPQASTTRHDASIHHTTTTTREETSSGWAHGDAVADDDGAVRGQRRTAVSTLPSP